MIGVTLATAFSLRDGSTNKKLQLTIEGDLDTQMPADTKWEITLAPPSPDHTLKTCWVRVWVVKFCTFVIPDQAQIEDTENEMEPLSETESCDQLGCTMFCKKNHFKKGVCHKKGCECDFE